MRNTLKLLLRNLMVILKYAIDDLSYILFAGLGLLVLFGVSYYKILIVKKFS